METLLNKIVLVVGGTGGIGAETCKLLHQSGAKVYVTGRNAESLNTICNSIGIPVENRFVVDLKDADSIHQTVENIQSTAGSAIDILINAAGIGIIKSFESLSIQEFKDSLDVNLIGAFSLIQAVLPKMKEQKKRVDYKYPRGLG